MDKKAEQGKVEAVAEKILGPSKEVWPGVQRSTITLGEILARIADSSPK
jgi:hypothetical protein